MQQAKKLLNSVVDVLKDLLVAFLSCHILYLPFTRLIMTISAKCCRISADDLEKSYNTAVILLFQNRGKKFLMRIRRLQRYGSYCEREEGGLMVESRSVRQALAVLGTPPSGALRKAVGHDIRYPLIADFPEMRFIAPPDAIQSAIIEPEAAVSISVMDCQQLTARAHSVERLIYEIFDRDKRNMPASYVLRKSITETIRRGLGRNAAIAERISFLGPETRIAALMLAWLGIMESSPMVMEETCQAGFAVLGRWLALKVRKHESNGGLLPEEITDEEAVMIAKTIVSMCFRSEPDVRYAALLTVRKLSSNEDVLNLGSKEPAVKTVFDILGLPEKFRTLNRDLSVLLGTDVGLFGNHFPVDHDFATGTVSILLDPARHHLASEIDDAACLVALRFPIMARLAVVADAGTQKNQIFSVGMREFYDSRLIQDMRMDYNPASGFPKISPSTALS